MDRNSLREQFREDLTALYRAVGELFSEHSDSVSAQGMKAMDAVSLVRSRYDNAKYTADQMESDC